MQAPGNLQPRPPTLALPGLTLLLAGLSLLLYPSLAALHDLPDAALRLAALLALPLPPLALHYLTTPPLQAARRLLGETASQVTNSSLRLVLLLAAPLLMIPLVLGAQALLNAQSEMLHLALFLLASLLLTLLTSLTTLLHALRLLSHGQSQAWKALAGGGAFGPAEGAPLLYLPALGLVTALTPLAIWTAIWNVHPEKLTPLLWICLPIASLLAGAWTLHRAWLLAQPHLHAGLRAAEQIYAARFAEADLQQPPPFWLTLGTPPPHAHFLALAQHRRWPLSALTTLALVLLTTLLLHPNLPMPLVILPVLSLVLLSAARVGRLQQQPEWQATRWLGLAPVLRLETLRRLGLGLLLPAFLLIPLLFFRHQLLAGLLGALLGVVLSSLSLRMPESLGRIRLIAWGTYAISLGATLGIHS